MKKTALFLFFLLPLSPNPPRAEPMTPVEKLEMNLDDLNNQVWRINEIIENEILH